MSNINSVCEGTALLLNFDGTLNCVFRDDLNMLSHQRPATPFFDLNDNLITQNIKSVIGLLDVADDPGNYLVPFEVEVRNEPEPIKFLSIKLTEGYLLIGTNPSTDVRKFFWSLLSQLKTSPESLDTLIEARKISEIPEHTPEIDENVFTQLTQLNNELSAAQRSLYKKNAELNQLTTFKNEMMGMAAHDLGNSLSSIIGLSDLLLNDQKELGSLNDKQKNFIQLIHESGRHMLRLVRNLLDYSQIDSGTLKLEYEEIDLIYFTERVISKNWPATKGNNLSIKLNAPEKLPSLRADSHKLEQVLHNLISNAIKYSYPDSEIEVTLNYTKTEQHAHISVSDQGPGISEKDQAKLFKPFSRIDNPKTRGKRGTGLGLAISRQIITAHNGLLNIESELGKGATFIITLPFSEHVATSTQIN